MTDTPTLSEVAHEKPPFYRDATVIKWIVQVIALALVVFALFFMKTEASNNLNRSKVPTDFRFIETNPGIQVSEGIDTLPNTGGRALWVGMVNTVRMAAVGILAATILGVIVGLARLSKNWIVNKVGNLYIETIRNIPLLVQMYIWFAILGTLPKVRVNQGPIHGWIHISNKGLSIPRVFPSDGFYQWMVIVLIGAVVARFVHKRQTDLHDATGHDTYPVWSALGVIAGFGLVGWFIHPIFGFLGGWFDQVAKGIHNVPEFALQIVLSLVFIAAAARFIRNFIDQHRTPAGVAQLSDDDWFRMIFAGVGAAIGVFVVLIAWPGLSSWMINSSRDLFELLGTKFGHGRSGPPIDAMRPDIVKPGKFANYGTSGLNLTIGFAAVFFGVVLYTAAFIGEIVRGGILAISKGQTEAASALGLRRGTALRKVILPQAFRIVLPPLGNQYLNLTKNTSLAIAVGYSDLVQVGQTVYNQTGKTLPVIAIWMLFYLATSLAISVVVNFFNVRLKIVER